MSYRLINANAIAKSYPEVNDMPCIYADLPRGMDNGYYDMREPGELQSENAKLREFATLAWQVLTRNEPLYVWKGMVDDARDLGLEEMADGRADD